MKKDIEKVIESIFSISLIISILGGGVIFLIFLVAIVMGGNSAEVLATKASKEIMPYFIRTATVAVACGLISFYISGEHALSLDED